MFRRTSQQLVAPTKFYLVKFEGTTLSAVENGVANTLTTRQTVQSNNSVFFWPYSILYSSLKILKGVTLVQKRQYVFVLCYDNKVFGGQTNKYQHTPLQTVAELALYNTIQFTLFFASLFPVTESSYIFSGGFTQKRKIEQLIFLSVCVCVPVYL